MEISWGTMLIQKDDGSLWFVDGDNECPASATDICKHIRNMQYSLITNIGCWVTDASNIVKQQIGEDRFEELFWQLEYREMPDNCNRIK